MLAVHQILFFFAALSFFFLGLVDVAREKAPFHLLMIFAGSFGVASAVFIEENIYVSNILSCVSVHLFLCEGIALLVQTVKRDMSDEALWYKRLIIFADLEFIFGSILDLMVRKLSFEIPCSHRLLIKCFNVVYIFTLHQFSIKLSYFYLFDDTADWDTALAITWVFSAALWLHCSLIYLSIFCYDKRVEAAGPEVYEKCGDSSSNSDSIR